MPHVQPRLKTIHCLCPKTLSWKVLFVVVVLLLFLNMECNRSIPPWRCLPRVVMWWDLYAKLKEQGESPTELFALTTGKMSTSFRSPPYEAPWKECVSFGGGLLLLSRRRVCIFEHVQSPYPFTVSMRARRRSPRSRSSAFLLLPTPASYCLSSLL